MDSTGGTPVQPAGEDAYAAERNGETDLKSWAMVARLALTDPQSFLLSLVAILILAASAALTLQTSLRIVSLPAPIAVLFCPLLIPPDAPILRAAASILSIDAMFRLVELFRHTGPLSLGARLRFLAPFPIFLSLADLQARARRPGVGAAKDWWKLILGSGGFAVCWMILEACSSHAALRADHLLDHTFKLVLFVMAVEMGAQALCGLERIAGFRTKPLVSRTWLSATPAEFWRRWNDRVHRWLFSHVFQVCGGSGRPARGIWCVCLFSGAFHELMFGIATSRFDGYQFAFFTMQAPAIPLSGKLKAFARQHGVAGRALSRAGTVLWFWATSLLFFHGVDRVVPIYYTSAPWLP